MKVFIVILMMVWLLSSCKTTEVFKPTCTNVVLDKVDWTYCYLHNNNIPIKCNNKNDTLTWKLIKTVTDVKATVITEKSPGGISYFLELDEAFEETRVEGTKSIFKILDASNLPDCFKRDKLRVLISGDLRPYYKLTIGIGDPFGLTKIEEIP